MNQTVSARMLTITFQQIQKYENGTKRLHAVNPAPWLNESRRSIP